MQDFHIYQPVAIDQEQYTNKELCQNPAPLAEMKGEQKKLEIEADSSYAALNTLLARKAIYFLYR